MPANQQRVIPSSPVGYLGSRPRTVGTLLCSVGTDQIYHILPKYHWLASPTFRLLRMFFSFLVAIFILQLYGTLY